ncbi:MAG: hypothetical protein H6708_30750 [Kofleriaceae bacterium]|nr:hypothetical protein [Kofleriaceae bacterium]
MSLSRRDLLRLLGGSAAAGALWACGGAAPRAAARRSDPEDVRRALRDAVATVRGAFPAASGWAALRTRTSLIAASGARGTATEVTATVVLRAQSRGGAVLERVGADATPAAIAALAAELAARGGDGGGTLDPGPPIAHLATVAVDPAATEPASWLAPLDAILARTLEQGSSRIVWQAAHGVIDDESAWTIADGVDVARRTVRVTTGVSAMAWSGNRPMLGEVVRGQAAGVEALALPDAAITRATAQALELLTPGDVPAGEVAVVLDPSVTAALLARGVAAVATSGAWTMPDLAARARLGQTIAAADVTVVDDPTSGGFAGYAVDDEGQAAAPLTLVDRGVLAAVLCDAHGARRTGLPRTGHGRRRPGDGAATATASDLTMTAGAADDDALLEAIGDGLLIEDALGAAVDPRRWQVVVRAARARRVVRGRLSGHVWGDVELRGEVPALLGGVTAIGAATATRIGDDDGLPSSVTAPAVATRGLITPRRSS